MDLEAIFKTLDAGNSLNTKVDCAKHGKDSAAYINNSCIACAEEEEKIKEQEEAKEILFNKQKNSGIPFLFQNATFENYLTDNEHVTHVLDTLKRYDYTKNIYLLGNTGIGKTHLACSLARDAIIKNKSVFYTPYYQLTSLKIKEEAKFKQVINRDIFIIDEYGVDQSEWKSTLLFEICNERYNNCVPTIIISNLGVKEFKNSLLDAVKSRFLNNAIELDFESVDYRKKKRK